MPSPLKKSQKDKEDINQQLHNTIYKKLTKENHKHGSPQKGDKTINKCIEFFKKEADPNVLNELEKSLKGQKEKESYNYYTKNFLPALKAEVIESGELAKSSVFNNERNQSQRPQTIRGKIVGIILGITNRSSDRYSKIEEQPINSIKEEIPVSSTEMTENNVESLMTQDQTQQKLESLTKEEVCASDSDSGINSPGLASSSRRSSLTLVTSTSSEESVNLTLNPVEEKKDPQTENEKETVREKNRDPRGQATQVKGSQAEGSIQSEEKKDKKNTATAVQESPANKNNSEDTPPKKQPNNRNLHVALVAGCALSTIGCIVAGAITSGPIGAGLFVVAAVFAIAAVAELHSNFLSSKLTSINVSPFVDGRQQGKI